MASYQCVNPVEYGNVETELVELPEVKDFSFFDLFTDEDTSINLNKISLSDIFPDEMATQLETLNIVPVVMNDEIQFIMPYNIVLD